MFVSGCVGGYSDNPIDVFGDLVPEANPWVSEERRLCINDMWLIASIIATKLVSWAVSTTVNAKIINLFCSVGRFCLHRKWHGYTRFQT